MVYCNGVWAMQLSGLMAIITKLLAINQMSSDVVALTKQRRDELAEILPTRSNWSQIEEWRAGTLPLINQHYGMAFIEFESIFNKVKWVTLPRGFHISPARKPWAPGRQQTSSQPTDYSKIDAAEATANDQLVQDAHKQLLAFLNGLIALHGIDDGTSTGTEESDAIFLDIDGLISNSSLPLQYRTIITADVVDARKSYRAGAFKSCVVMLGAALEGVMLGTLMRSDVIASLVAATKPPGPIKDIGNRDPLLADKIGSELTFEDYKVCIHELIPGSSALGIDNIQSFRNAVHPWKAIQEPMKYSGFDHARAMHYIGSFKKIVEAICQWTP